MIELKDLTAAEVIAFHKQGRYVSGFKGWVETTPERIKEKPKHEEGFKVASEHEVSFEQHTKSHISKDKKKALIKLGLVNYDGIYAQEVDAQEFDAYLKKFGESSIKGEADINWKDYDVETASVEEKKVVVKSELENYLGTLNSFTKKQDIIDWVKQNGWDIAGLSTNKTIAQNVALVETYLRDNYV